MRIHVLLIALTLSLPACAQQSRYRIGPLSQADVASKGARFPDAQLLAQVEGSDDVTVKPDAPRGASTNVANLPDIALTQDLLYKFLLAEIAGQRGNLRLAARAYLELAQATHDPRVAKRATEVVLYGRFNDIAAQAASVWLDIDPDSQQARQTLIATLLGNNDLADAKPLLKKLLASDKARTPSLFLQLPPLLSRYPDHDAAFRLVQELAQPYGELPEAHLAVAQSAVGVQNFDVAQSEADQALALKPDLQPAALLKAQLLRRKSVPDALAYLAGYVSDNPQARDVRLYYGRLLAANKQPDDARKQFQLLEAEMPGSADVAVMIGLLSLQLHDNATAEAKLKRAIELKYRDPDTLRFYLGQIAEEQGRDSDALAYYSQVRSGDQMIPAAARYAFILSKEKKFDEARQYLQGIEPQDDQQKVLLVQAEAQVLRDAKQYGQAYDLLNDALAKQPDNPDLLYDVAMAAEKVDKLDVLEAKLKRLIELKPDHAQAYNALGYTLADRNVRLPEAQSYIEKALQLSPNDAFILDSMGWVYYRQGELDKGLDYLNKAFAQRPDPEIAAHLGEVLWAKGLKQEAEKVWRDSLAQNPDNDDLKATVAKFLK
ncbi:MAG: tetratricopeptide repeat protein [Betaproteobacteria bacterium]|nr:tetratricopeptide repeat protein [Betaproteobacteria bacterium]